MDGWTDCLLGDIITFQRGHDLPKTKMIRGEYPVVGSNGIIGYHNKYTTEAPSVTIGRSGNTGNPFIVYGCSWSHNTTLYIKEFKGSDPIYVYYLLKTLDLGNFAGGSAVPTLNRNHIHTIKISVPSLPEQIEIGLTLRALDDKIKKNIEINNHLEQMAQAIFKSWFVDFEPWGGVMPEDWREGTLDEIANITMGQSPNGASYNEDGIGTVFYQGRAEFGFRYPTRRLFTTQPKRMATKGDIIMSVRAPVGDLNVASESCCLGRGLASIQSNNNTQSFILYTMFALKSALDMFNGEGTVFGSINKNDMEKLPVIIPADKVTRLFEELVHPIDCAIEVNCTENSTIKAIRDSLLPRLMSGELSISDIPTM